MELFKFNAAPWTINFRRRLVWSHTNWSNLFVIRISPHLIFFHVKDLILYFVFCFFFWLVIIGEYSWIMQNTGRRKMRKTISKQTKKILYFLVFSLGFIWGRPAAIDAFVLASTCVRVRQAFQCSSTKVKAPSMAIATWSEAP